MRIILVLIFLIPFLSLSQMTIEGSANGACDCYTITDNTNQAGAIWSPNTIDLSNPFDFTFEVNLGCNDVWGADGMMFVLQANPNGLGDIGNGIGYGNYPGNPNPISTNSVGLEIDTWNSNPTVVTDINSDHVGMSSGLNNEHDVVAPIAIPNIEDCAPHEYRVTWDPGTMTLNVYIDGTLVMTYNGDLVTNFFGGNPNVYFGWTGSTGGVDNVQTVCMYRNADFTADLTTVCENQTISFTDNSTSELNMITDWAWDFGDGNTSTQQNPTHSYSTSGTYSVELTITDISGCTDVHTVNITVNPGLNLNMTSQDVSCFGASDGQATATSTNGSAPYTYLWDDPSTQTMQTATGLAPDTYNVTVEDNAGCVGSGSVTINQPTQLVIDSVVTIDASCGINNGEITIYANGGTSPYNYSIDGGTTLSGSSNFTGLAPNSYNIVVEDDNGCTETTTATINSNSSFVIDSLVTTDETCGQSDGTITVYVSSGLAPYQYSIDGGTTYQGSNVFSGLSANTYTIQVMDDNNCTETANTTINSPTTLSIDSVTLTDPSCNGYLDGEVEIHVTGGTSPYNYSIDNGTTFQGSSTFSALSSGSYDIVVEDDLGCQTSVSEVLTDPASVVIDNVNTTDVSCSGSTDGEIEIFASGGVGGFTYSIDNGATFQGTSLFTGLAPNTYDLQVNDANGCFATTTATVGEPLPVIIDSIVVTDVTCNGLSDGEIEIFANQGTAPYQYSIDGTNFQVSSVFTGLSAGQVNVDVLDDNGCSASGSVTISESQPVVATISTDTTICIGGSTNLCANVSGGTAPFEYYWNNTLGGQCLNTSTTGVYDLEVIDDNGCSAAIVSTEVFQYPPISITVTPDETICPGDPVQMVAEATGGNGGPYTFIWENQNTLNTSNGAIQIVNPTTTTIYEVQVEDGCETPVVTDQVEITTYTIPQIIIQSDTNQGCEPLEVLIYSGTNSSLISSISWDYGNGNLGASDTSLQLYEDPGCYDVSAEITTVDGCVDDTTMADFICVYELPIADFEYSPDSVDILDTEVDFDNNSQNASTYEWVFGDGDTSSQISPSHFYPEESPVDYEVSLIAITDFGCRDTAVQIITMNEVILFYAPNAVTLNASGINSEFKPVFIPGFVPYNYSLQIFNRWGELLFETTDYTQGWDGTYLDQLVHDGTYVWKITFLENQTDIVHEEIGHVTVLK